ncbi:MAG: YhbY family RNA-binding protein [Candidatus Hodarchaeales archaeon]
MKRELNDKLVKLRQESPSLQIGKNGISPLLLKELEERIKQKKMIKVKILKNSPYKSRSEAFDDLRSHLPPRIEVMEVRGWTAVLRKR